MKDDDAVQLLVQRTIADACTLPCHAAAELLRGLIALGGDHPALEEVRPVYVALNECDAQLELLARK